MTPRLRDTLTSISLGMNTNDKLSRALGIHVNTAALYAKRLANEGYVDSTQQLESTDPRFRDAGRVRRRYYVITDKGQQLLNQAST